MQSLGGQNDKKTNVINLIGEVQPDESDQTMCIQGNTYNDSLNESTE